MVNRLAAIVGDQKTASVVPLQRKVEGVKNGAPRFDDRFNRVPLFVWVLVELTRDRNNVNTTRDTVRAACRRWKRNLRQTSRVAESAVGNDSSVPQGL